MIIITGASSGIGEACALLLAKKKTTMILIARREDRLKAISLKCQSLGSKVFTFKLDISKTKDVLAWAQENNELLSQCEVLINNAGLALGLKTFDQVNFQEWDQMINVNIKALMLFSSLVLPHFIKNDRGHIVNLGSVAGHVVYPKGNVYCATKHAVHAFSQSLRIDLLGKNIRISEISPGMVETEFSEVRLGDKEKAKKIYEGMIPLSANDVAETILWCLDRPGHVNIQEIVMYPTAQASPTLVHREKFALREGTA